MNDSLTEQLDNYAVTCDVADDMREIAASHRVMEAALKRALARFEREAEACRAVSADHPDLPELDSLIAECRAAIDS